MSALRIAYTCDRQALSARQNASICSLPRCGEVSAQSSFLSTLDESRLVFQDGESLLQPGNLSFPARLSLLVCLWLGNAPVLDFAIVVHYCAELGVCGLAVR